MAESPSHTDVSCSHWVATIPSYLQTNSTNVVTWKCNIHILPQSSDGPGYCDTLYCDRELKDTNTDSTTDCLPFDLIGWIVGHILNINWCALGVANNTLDVHNIQDGLLQDPVWGQARLVPELIIIAHVYQVITYLVPCKQTRSSLTEVCRVLWPELREAAETMTDPSPHYQACPVRIDCCVRRMTTYYHPTVVICSTDPGMTTTILI